MTTMKSGKPSSEGTGGAPTDLELMLYVDGELDEARCREIDVYLTRDAGCRTKVLGLEAAATSVRDDALASDLGDGIADAVMERIEQGGARDGNGAATHPVSVVDLAGDADGPAKAQRFEQKPANDNARGIFALAAIAVAAAAAMMIWGRMEAEPPRAASTAPPSVQTVTAPTATIAEPTTPEGENELGVEVAAVDFGARMGTIFYVPQGSTASSPTTTVVWLSDDASGGE